MRTLVIAAPHSGCGKTTLTAGLIAALRTRGQHIQPFKVGPDYIDPSYTHLHFLANPQLAARIVAAARQASPLDSSR